MAKKIGITLFTFLALMAIVLLEKLQFGRQDASLNDFPEPIQ